MNGTAEIKRNEWTTQVSDVRISYSEAVSDQDETLAALEHRYRGRGFLRAAKEHGKEMDAMEEQARACAPEHYRWEELCANGRGDRFRNATYLGRQVMDVDGFAAYFDECRASRRTRSSETALTVETVAPARTRGESRIARATGRSIVAYDKKRQTGESTTDKVITIAKDWLCPDDPALRRMGKKQRVPVSVISLFVVATVSLMLIVSSTVMVSTAKRDAANAQDTAAELQHEAQLAKDKLESSIDYLEIYRTATEELGMIPASYVDSVYVDAAMANSIEVVDQEEDTPALSTLLSAIGIGLE
ncbi:MAG: hypothetical protein IIX15_04155 [Clostridia bacterium]|nr:hypothetical protein [Clostridia bacterium]